VTSDPPPGDPGVIARIGPWTVLNCITASCTRCGAVPLDEDTGLTPHFRSSRQAAEELGQEWGWRCTARSTWPENDELLCPACAQAGEDPGKPAVTADNGHAPDTAPGRAGNGQAPHPGLPVNARVSPAVRRTREEG
jgi:hypothetical protein